ncbi:hypothetical protein KCU91_g14603, partial [Aureobasidium melanogenum]
MRSSNEIFLPKGRKDENECLKAAALRETYEETGYSATILPLKVPTHVTNRTGDGEHEEPIAVTQRIKDGVLKIIFWYAASVNSQEVPTQGTQQEGEDFEAVWMECTQALAALTFNDDREVAQLAIDAAFDPHHVNKSVITSPFTVESDLWTMKRPQPLQIKYPTFSLLKELNLMSPLRS